MNTGTTQTCESSVFLHLQKLVDVSESALRSHPGSLPALAFQFCLYCSSSFASLAQQTVVSGSPLSSILARQASSTQKVVQQTEPLLANRAPLMIPHLADAPVSQPPP